ncbi:MAG: hypothetical protein QM786_13595 [Breznakibacter sp.]
MEIELVPIVFLGGLYATIISISYFRTRKTERLSLIAAGKEASIFDEADKKPKLHSSFKYGLLMIGLALGLLVGEALAKSTAIRPEIAYTSMVLIFGGISLLFFYWYQNKMAQKSKNEI